jgi:Superinfection immunity protein
MLATISGGGAIVLGFAVYFLPSIVAYGRKVTNSGSVFVINLFLGWTFVGWVVALAMACRTSVMVREGTTLPPASPAAEVPSATPSPFE